jgi:hypothetical protein
MRIAECKSHPQRTEPESSSIWHRCEDNRHTTCCEPNDWRAYLLEADIFSYQEFVPALSRESVGAMVCMKKAGILDVIWRNTTVSGEPSLLSLA